MSEELSSIIVEARAINGKEVPAVTSLQVAEHFGKEHFNVLNDIRRTIDKCSESFNALNFQAVEYTDAKGEKRPMYLLSKDGFMMVAMGYTTSEAMHIKEAYIARFNEMERELAERNHSLPQTYADALRALAAEVEIREAIEQQKALAESQRDEAIRTKALIGSRREATAMNTASQLAKENDTLRTEIGDAKHWKQVKAIPWFAEIFIPSPGAYQVLGKNLGKLSARMGYKTKTAEDSRYGTVKVYHVDVIEAYRLALLQDRNMMSKYRKQQ